MTKNVYLMIQVLSFLISANLFAQTQIQVKPEDVVVVTGNPGFKPFDPNKVTFGSINFGSGLISNTLSNNNSPFGVNYNLNQFQNNLPISTQLTDIPGFEFTAEMGAQRYNTATSGIIQNQSDANALAKERMIALCDYVVESKVLGKDSQIGSVCKMTLANPVDKCGLGNAVKQESFNQLVDQLKNKKNSSPAADLKKECFQFALNAWNDVSKMNLEPNSQNAFSISSFLRTNWYTPALYKVAGMHEHRQTTNTNIACPVLGQETADGSSCDDFSNTVLGGSSFGEIARKYVVALPDFGGSFLPAVFGKNCSSCFPERYSFLKSQKPNPEGTSDEIQSKFKKQSEDKYNDYVDKKSLEKAVLAFSEYTKHLDRRNAYSSIIGREGGEASACSDPANIKIEMEKVRKSKFGCVSDNALNKRIKEISTKIQLGSMNPISEAKGIEDLFQIVEGRAQEEISNPPTPSTCLNNSVPRSGYDKLRTSEFSDIYLGMFRDALKDKNVKEKYEKCAPEDEICLVNVMRGYFGKALSEDTIQITFLNNPFLRLLVKNKAGWEAAMKMKLSPTVAENFEKNKSDLLTLIEKDEKASCANLQHDLALALCMKPDKAASMLTPSKMKMDMERAVDAINSSEKDQLDKNLEILEIMGQACYAISKNDFEKDSKLGLFTSDASANVQNYADPVLRVGMIDKMENSAKIGDEFTDYARRLCNTAKPSSLISENPFQTNAPCMELNCTGKAFGGGRFGGFSGVKSEFGIDYDINPNKPYTNYFSPTSSSGSGLYGYKPIQLSSSYFNTDTRPVLATSDEELKRTFSDKSTATLQPLSSSGAHSQDLNGVSAHTIDQIKQAVESPNDKTAKVTTPTDGRATTTVASNDANVTSTLIGGPVTTGVSGNGVISNGSNVVIGSGAMDLSRSVGSQSNRTSFNTIEKEEVVQTNAERSVVDQASTLKDARAQLELEKLRLEMDQLRQSNKTLMAGLKKKQTPGSNVVENPFDTQEPEETDELPITPKVEAIGRKPASIPSPTVGGVSATTNIPTAKAIESIGSGNTTTSTRDSRPAQTTVVSNFQSGLAANGGVLIQNVSQVSVARGGTSFVPSLSLQQSIQTSSAAEPISIEKKVQLVKEFLSYVESNPEYKEGRYLNSNNDQITIDYAGTVMTVKVEDIADPLMRSQLKDRLVRQRLVLNQQARKQRLESLRRLLASARSDVP